MTRWRAARLARIANEGGERARRARRRLDDAVVRGDLDTARTVRSVGYRLDAAWARLLPDIPMPTFTVCRRPVWRVLPIPDDTPHPFSLLVSDPDPQVLTGEMRAGVVAAATVDHPVAEVARAKILANLTDELRDELRRAAEFDAGLAASCQRHDLVPSDPLGQARYLLLTGQLAAYRAFDPDGELFARAYAVAPEEDKAAMRERLLRLGAIDTLRRLVDRDGAAETARLGEQDVTRLGRALAEREDWPALWRLAADVSIVAAASLVRLLDPGWRPVGEADRRLLGVLRSVPPERLVSAMDEPTLFRRLDAGDDVHAMSLAPDGSQLVVMRGYGSRVDVFDLASGALVGSRSWGDGWGSTRLVHCGAAGLVGQGEWGLVRVTRERVDALAEGQVWALTSAAGSFAALTPEGVLIGVPGRDDLVRVPATRLGLGRLTSLRRPSASAASLDGSRFAFAVDDRFVVLDATGAELTRSGRLGRVAALTFLGPTELVTSVGSNYTEPHTVTRWRVGGRVPVECAVTKTMIGSDVVGLPGPRRLVALDDWDSVEILDGETLASRADESASLGLEPGRKGVLARAGDSPSAFALRHFGSSLPGASVVEVHDLRRLPLRGLLDRPVVTMRPADLEAAATLAAAFGDDPVVRVVHDALAMRFGREVSLGAVRAHADDIAIADEGGGVSC